MKISQAGIDLIKNFEGCSLKAYKVDGAGEKYWTIGYGSYGPHVKEGQVITKAQAEELLKEELERFVKGVDELVKVELNSNQEAALISFAYNCGLGNLKSSTLLKKVNAKDFKGAANEFGKWNKAGDNVLKGLVRRRAAEKELFLKAATKPKAVPEKSAQKGKNTPVKPEYHIVQKNENVTGIAKKYKTTVAAIKKINPKIKDINLVYPKQKIRVK
jgi:GH24 family phage-related lysozyme (muramidase)